jgi:acetylornithine deacetylase/succinyl-diaminopimelate desuccinylase-like protein
MQSGGRRGPGRRPLASASVAAPGAQLQDEAVALLAELIRFDTVNPPGNERAAQEHLAGVLSGAGFECELLGSSFERPNLVARLDGAEPGPVLCLLSHVDTVLATPSEWSHDPWSGELADGFVWGRGALDMKSQTAAEVIAATTLARAGWRPARGSLLVVALVDEETGGAEGARWLTATHPEKVRCDYLLNEGGGGVVDYEGRRVYALGCAEKGVFRFVIHTDGVAAHGSMPRLGDNALLKLGPILERFAARQPSYMLTAEPRAFLEGIGALAPGDDDAAAALERVRAAEPRLVALVEPMLGVSLAPTRAFASEKINVIPSQARLAVDCRVPAGLGVEAAQAAIDEVLGPGAYRVEWLEQVVGNRSPVDSPLAEVIRGWIAEHEPGALCVPVTLPGFTDSRTFRDAFPECAAYGFFPHRVRTRFETDPLIHGADERIDVRDLEFATRFFGDVCERLLGWAPDARPGGEKLTHPTAIGRR